MPLAICYLHCHWFFPHFRIQPSKFKFLRALFSVDKKCNWSELILCIEYSMANKKIKLGKHAICRVLTHIPQLLQNIHINNSLQPWLYGSTI